MSVFKNEEGRRVLADWYEKFVDALSEVSPVTFEQVDTRYGQTNVLMTGPEDAPPLLCFHGAMGTAASALYLVQPLIPHFRIVFPDTVGQPGRSAETYLPMRGDAYAKWAVDVLDGLGLDRVLCIGVSMGGYIALKLAQYHPERIERLSLWVPGGLVNGSPWDTMRLAWVGLSVYLWPSEARFRRMTDAIFTDTDATYMGFYRDAMSHLNMDRRMPELAADDAFRGLRAPVQLLANEHDVLFPPDKLLGRARKVFPNLADVEVLPGYKHVPPFEPGRTDADLERIRGFLLDQGA